MKVTQCDKCGNTSPLPDKIIKVESVESESVITVIKNLDICMECWKPIELVLAKNQK